MTGLMWKFETARFRIEWEISPDDDLDLSWDETGETAEKLASGEWSAFMSKVAVYFDGHQVSAEYLGGSIYADPADFRDHWVKGNYGSYFTDMVSEAIAQARETILNMHPVYIRKTG